MSIAAVDSAHGSRPDRPRIGFGLVLVISLALGAARTWAAPSGYNVDEWARLPSAIRLAACWRQTAGWLGRSPGAVAPWPCWRASRFDGNPSYYLLLSIPVAFIPDAALNTQYYAARLTTVGLGLVILGLAWLTCGELLGERQRLVALGIVGATALNQSFGDIVSGVNSDASSATALAFLFYALARLQNRWRRSSGSDRMRDVGLLAATVGLGYLSSASALWLAVPVLAWWWLSQRGWKIRLGALATVLAAIAALLIIPNDHIQWTTPQYWFNAGRTEILGASPRKEAAGPVGTHALRVILNPVRQSQGEVQFLPDGEARRLAGKTITFGAWLHAPGGEQVEGPIWDDGSQRVSRTATATGDWQFVAATAQVRPGATTGAVFLMPPASGAEALFDGLVVAEGSFPTDAPPQFADATGRAGTWGGKPFANLLLNPSIEATWPTLRVEGMPRDFVAYNGRIRSFLAWRRTAPSALAIVSWLFAGFWSEFSGLHPGLSRAALLPFVVVALAGAVGAVLAAFSPARRAPPEWRVAIRFFAPIAIIIWATVTLRADLWPNLPAVLSFAGARYAAAATGPTLALLILGGLYWLPARSRPKALAVLLIGLWLVAVHVLLAEQIPFYQCLLAGNGTGSCLR